MLTGAAATLLFWLTTNSGTPPSVSAVAPSSQWDVMLWDEGTWE